ncbi:hypothetical protein NECAME_16748 [Necator americanus]|uniref:Uncharacterized protein n=1 Tax=Necator americanus TaxID=51031 RepID=W2TTR7_NECAM|nr:hypothetical protein NECAME_16748 [Necator americanus]ETN85470.1 hypothetical protein NECAME_16748 [Necator americanus]
MQSTFAFLLCAATVSAIYLNNPNSYTKRRQLRNLPRPIRAIRPRYVEPNDDSVYLRDTDFSLITSDVMNNRDTLPDSDDLFNAPISLGKYSVLSVAMK